MKIRIIATILFIIGYNILSTAQNQTLPRQYNASLFGIKSDGVTMNTRSIQKALDWISEQGGGELTFWVGRYLTGSVHLRSNVTIRLLEGAVLEGSANPYDYDKICGTYALVIGEKCDHVAIVGKGNIIGHGRELGNNFAQQVHAGILKDALKYDRVSSRPRLVYFRECNHVEIQDITLKDAAEWVQTYDQCTNVVVDHIFVESCAYWNNDGIDIVDCNGFLLKNSYFNSSDDAICLKSHSKDALCQNVEIRNCTARSSANGIKLGTFGLGGFKNIRIIGNTVYNTYRSAITIQSVDGGICEDILVDSLTANNVGNPIYIVVGDRRRPAGKMSTMKNITVRNVTCTVPATMADAGYEYEGPIEDNPRNISPSSVVGLPESHIENVVLENIMLNYPGGGDSMVARVRPDELDRVPEMPKAYPEFSQFKELPAWGFFVRHVDGITFKNVRLTAQKSDYRLPFVLDNVSSASFENVSAEMSGNTVSSEHLIFERR